METRLREDPFRDKIREILVTGFARAARDDFKSRVFAEVQNYSRGLQEAENTSDFFFQLCEVIVDCQSLSIPNDSFIILVAGLLCESGNEKSCPEEQVRQLIGMDSAAFEVAKESFKNRQCIASALNKEKTGRKGSIMAGKRNFSRAEQTDVPGVD
ncbi:hypothetical protein SBDP1_380031 [Syntrophobacter sp. SbD1]|nr:hypothetical protein SBDP1_380031 [Syntrophobacter sp. SbD1]